MISWLQGQRVGNWQQGLRYGLILDCGGVGYEVQLPRSVLDKLELDDLQLVDLELVHLNLVELDLVK